MKKNVLFVLAIGAAFVLASCGGITKPEKDLDGAKKLKDDYVSLLEKRNEVEKDKKEALEELEEKWVEEAKGILEEYEGALTKDKNEKIRDCEEKIADSQDEQAIKDWIKFKVAQREFNIKYGEVASKYRKKLEDLYDAQWAYETSVDLLRLIDKDKAKDAREYKEKEIETLMKEYNDIWD